jgi:multiple sugar transport system substrate-binding protein
LFGAAFYDSEKNQITTTSPEFMEAIEFQNWFYKEFGWDNIHKFMLKFGANEQDPFYSKKLAMVMGGEWVPSEVKKYAPDMELVVCEFPYPDDKPYLKDTSMIAESVLYIPKGTAYKEASWEFLKYFASDESMLAFSTGNKSLSARRSVLQNPLIKENPDFGVFSGFALNPKISGFSPVPVICEYLDSLTEQIQMVFMQKKTVYEAMSDVKKKIDPLLEKY